MIHVHIRFHFGDASLPHTFCRLLSCSVSLSFVFAFFCLLFANVLTQKFKNGAKSKLPNFTHRCSFSIFYSRLITNIVLLLLFQPILIFRKYPRLNFFLLFASLFHLYFYEYRSTQTANTNTERFESIFKTHC